MKKSLIFVLSAAALLASCAKEIPAPEEQNAPVQVKETVVFSAGVETRTAFGPLADGKYPNLWVAGDKIAVNGVESAEVEEECAGTSFGTFTVEDVAAPYCVAYPVAAFSDYAEGSANVTLPAEQTWAEGTYDPAAMIMLAKTSETEFTFGRAMSIIRITPTSAMGGIKAISLKSLDGKKLSGAFTTDFETITPADGASDIVTMKASAAVEAGKEWFITIPAGDYQTSGFQVTFTDANGNAIAKALAPSKEYAAGHVYTLSLDAFPTQLTVTGHDAVVAFCNTGRNDYEKLVIDGNNETISDSEMASLKLAVKDVADLTLKNIKGWTMLEQIMPGGDFTITPTGSFAIINCPNLNNINGLKWIDKINGDFVIQDCPNIPWNWGAGNCANQITEVTGNFTIKNAANALTGATCLASLRKVGGDFTISGVNANFWDLNGMPLEEIGGDFIYTDNALVNSFIGFAGLTKIGGNLFVRGTAITDFSQVQTWIDDEVLKGTAECWNGSEKVQFSHPIDITVTSQADIDAITLTDGKRLSVRNLTVTGSGVTDPVWASIKTKIAEVTGKLVAEDCAFTMCGNFFKGAGNTEGVECLGGIYFKNICCGSGQFLNSDNFPTVVNGDVVLENINIHGWPGAGFNMVTEVKGNLTIKTAMMGNNACFCLLQKVGGNLTIDGPQADFLGNRVWNVDQWTIKEIGGNFTLLNNKFVNFAGFTGITTIGGDLLVKGTEITDFSQVQTWLNNGVLKGAVECWNGSEKVTFERK